MEGRQKEILTKPRYTHKSLDTTRLLPVFYRAALSWRNSVTGQFLQWKIWSLASLPLALSHYSCFLSIPPDIILSPLQPALSLPSFSPPCSHTFIGLLPLTHHVSLPRFHPSLCRSLNPLSFALLGPHPSHFSSCLSQSRFRSCPISTYRSPFSFILPDSFPPC